MKYEPTITQHVEMFEVLWRFQFKTKFAADRTQSFQTDFKGYIFIKWVTWDQYCSFCSSSVSNARDSNASRIPNPGRIMGFTFPVRRTTWTGRAPIGSWWSAFWCSASSCVSASHWPDSMSNWCPAQPARLFWPTARLWPTAILATSRIWPWPCAMPSAKFCWTQVENAVLAWSYSEFAAGGGHNLGKGFIKYFNFNFKNTSTVSTMPNNFFSYPFLCKSCLSSF